jgi:hypothetical protein
MIFSKSKYIIIAFVTVISDESRASAFVPDDTRSKIGGGKNLIAASAPPESLSFASLFQKSPNEYQQHSPRMSEVNFRLDYVQRVRPSYNKVPENAPVENDHENTHDGT